MGTLSPCSLISALVVPTEDLYRLAKSYIDYPQFLKNERDKETMAPNFIGHVQSRRYHVPSLVNTGLNQLAGQHYSKIRSWFPALSNVLRILYRSVASFLFKILSTFDSAGN